MNNKKIKYQVASGVILIIVGIILLLLNYISDKREMVFSTMNLALTSANTNTELTNTEEEQQVSVISETNTTTNNTYIYENYLAQIEIPKINLYKGFYDKNSSLNNIKFNLYVMPTSSYPDIENGNLIIAGHSGNYNNSTFRDLYLLDTNDEIYIHYNNAKYKYIITNIYLQEKNGTINIYRNLSRTTLTLITCTQDDSIHQTVYIAELIEKE